MWLMFNNRCPSCYVIIEIFSATNPPKNDQQQHQFLEDLVFYICKGCKPLFTCKNVWF
jgi:hypothetical protein